MLHLYNQKSDTLDNKGYISIAKALNIQSNILTNTNGLIKANTLQMYTNTLQNIYSSIQAQDITLQADTLLQQGNTIYTNSTLQAYNNKGEMDYRRIFVHGTFSGANLL